MQPHDIIMQTPCPEDDLGLFEGRLLVYLARSHHNLLTGLNMKLLTVSLC